MNVHANSKRYTSGEVPFGYKYSICIKIHATHCINLISLLRSRNGFGVYGYLYLQGVYPNWINLE